MNVRVDANFLVFKVTSVGRSTILFLCFFLWEMGFASAVLEVVF